ncbi:hypothetical protein RYO59_001352 [Thermosynechococcaceae cyanobacterium Okahandja]
MKLQPPSKSSDDITLVHFLQTYAGTPPPPHPQLERVIVQAALQQQQRAKRWWRTLTLISTGAIATMATALLLKPSRQVAQEYPPDSVEAFVSQNWQVMFHESDLNFVD